MRTTPKLLVFLMTLLVFQSVTAFAQATPPFTRTVIVNAGNNAILNGANLLNALASIPATAGPNQPWLVKVEPGIFDLNGNQLVMRNFVDIEGSGRDATTITSNGALLPQNSPTVLAPAGIEAELRQLTVVNISNGSGIGVSIFTDDFLLTEVNLEVRTGNNATGVFTSNSSPRLSEIFARVAGARNVTGISILGGGTVVRESFVFVASPGSANTGYLINEALDVVLDGTVGVVLLGGQNIGVAAIREAAPEINDTRIVASGSDARGLWVFKEATPEIKESTFTASSDTLARAIFNEGSTARVTESTFRALPINADHLSVFAVSLTGDASLRANQSNFDSTSIAASNGGSGTAFFGASQLVGQVTGSSLTSFKCIFAYNSAYDPRNSVCQ